MRYIYNLTYHVTILLRMYCSNTFNTLGINFIIYSMFSVDQCFIISLLFVMSKMGNNDKNKKNVINNGHLLIFSCPCRASRMLTSSRVVASMSTPASLSLSIIFTAYGFPVILWIHFRTTLEIPLLAIKNMFNSYMRTSRNTG